MGGSIMLNVFIIEDKWIEQANLEKMVHKIEKQLDRMPFSVSSFSTLDKFLNHLPLPNNNNVFLLDIQINENKKAGLSLAQLLRKNDPSATIIFITIHDEFLPITYKYRVEALDFIAKDSQNVYQQLLTDFQHIINQSKKQPLPKLQFKSTEGYIYIETNNVLYFTPNPNNSHQSLLYLLDNRVITVNGTLNSIEKLSPLFFRTHRHCVINRSRVVEINTRNHTVTLSGTDYQCPLSRLRAQQLVAELNNFE